VEQIITKLVPTSLMVEYEVRDNRKSKTFPDFYYSLRPDQHDRNYIACYGFDP
jgi:hypothetical protein